MNKKAIAKKKHYRFLSRQIKNFKIHSEGWYNQWHMHLDWSGLSNKSKELRQKHIQYYLDLLDEAEKQINDNFKFQIWICIFDEDGTNDAIYIHTKNPHTDFPCKFNNFEWIDNLPEKYIPLDISKYKIGKINSEGIYYFIQKKGLGISL